MGAETLAGAALVEVGIAVIERTVPGGIARVKSWLKGKEVLIVGRSRAGKTSFVDYLQYGFFEDEKETTKTWDKVLSRRFDVKMGRNSALELKVKTVVDLPGQWGPMFHADLVFQRSPHAVLVFTDLTTPLQGPPEQASAAWLRDFCEHLESLWRARPRRRNRVMTMIVLMNKFDKATERKTDARKRAFRKILDAKFQMARGSMMDEIVIVPSIMVNNPQGTKLVDSVIVHLAKRLAR